MLFIFFLSSSLVSNISTITTILLENLAMFYMNSRLACILKKIKKTVERAFINNNFINHHLRVFSVYRKRDFSYYIIIIIIIIATKSYLQRHEKNITS